MTKNVSQANAVTALYNATQRLKRGLEYGADMRSSRSLCVADAMALIDEALACQIPDTVQCLARGARACLDQNANYNADLKAAINSLEDAMFCMKGVA